MKYCSKCGKELLDEAIVCPNCGCSAETKVQTNEGVKEKKKISKKLIALIVAAVILVALAIPAVMIFTANRDLKADDLTETSYIGAIFKFGIPSGSNSKTLKYDDGSVTLGGVRLKAFHVNYDEGEYVIMVDEDDTEELFDYLADEFDEDDLNISSGFVIIDAK